MFDEQIAFLRALHEIGGWVGVLEIESMRILVSADVVSIVAKLTEGGLIEFDAAPLASCTWRT
jgi:hypothetical protein